MTVTMTRDVNPDQMSEVKQSYVEPSDNIWKSAKDKALLPRIDRRLRERKGVAIRNHRGSKRPSLPRKREEKKGLRIKSRKVSVCVDLLTGMFRSDQSSRKLNRLRGNSSSFILSHGLCST